MSPDNLAIVLAPNLLRPPAKEETPQKMMKDSPLIITIIAFCFRNFKQVFR